MNFKDNGTEIFFFLGCLPLHSETERQLSQQILTKINHISPDADILEKK